MRAWLPLLFALSSCSFAVDTDDLAGGTRPTSDASTSADTGGSDSTTCNPDKCSGDDALVVPLAELAPCATETADKIGCRKKVSETCRAKNPCCFTGGYGPVAFPNPSEATILCFTEPTYDAPVSEIVGAAAGCTSSALASRACDNAVHASAKKRGKGTGVLQKTTGDTATVVGIETADETPDVPWADLAKLDPACTTANVEKQACTTAVQLYCTTGDFDGYLGGIGPLTWTASAVTVVCF